MSWFYSNEQEAAGYLMEVVKSRLEADGQSSTDDDILVALVANLQEAQKREAQRLLDEIENKVGLSVSNWNQTFNHSDIDRLCYKCKNSFYCI